MVDDAKAENKLNVGNYSEVLPTALWCVLIVSVTEAEELFSYLKQPFSEKSLLTRINIAWKSCWKICQKFFYHKEIFLLYLAKLTVFTYSGAPSNHIISSAFTVRKLSDSTDSRYHSMATAFPTLANVFPI